MKYKDMTSEQKKAHYESVKKWRSENKERYRSYMKKWKSEHIGYYTVMSRKRHSEHREEYNALMRKQRANDLNKNGDRKSHIRKLSMRILYKTHTKIHDYEIHHCFGYEDPNKFIYIPRSMHLKIHQLLRDNKILADSNHWNDIRDLVNSCEEYTYIRI